MPHDYVFGFKIGQWDCTLSFTISGNNISSKKEVVSSDRLAIVKVASVATVYVPHYTEFSILSF